MTWSLFYSSFFSQTLEQNANLILQVNQAMAEGRADVVGDLMILLGKNITFLSSAAAAANADPSLATRNSPPVHSSESPGAPAAGGPMAGPSSSARIPQQQQQQSPLPVRPHSQSTPPHASPPPGQQQQSNYPGPSNGQQYSGGEQWISFPTILSILSCQHQSINQSIVRYIIVPRDQSINQLNVVSAFQSINQLNIVSGIQSVSQSMKYRIKDSIDQSINLNIYQGCMKPISQ